MVYLNIRIIYLYQLFTENVSNGQETWFICPCKPRCCHHPTNACNLSAQPEAAAQMQAHIRRYILMAWPFSQLATCFVEQKRSIRRKVLRDVMAADYRSLAIPVSGIPHAAALTISGHILWVIVGLCVVSVVTAVSQDLYWKAGALRLSREICGINWESCGPQRSKAW